MIVYVTVQQAAVAEAGVAETIAGLLRQDFGNAARGFVGFLDRGLRELCRIKRLGKRLGLGGIGEVMRDVLRDFRCRRRGRMIAVRSGRRWWRSRLLIARSQKQRSTA